MPIKTADKFEQGRVQLPIQSRPDPWWAQPQTIFIVMIAFIIYSSFRAFENKFFEVEAFGYLSPFYSPPLNKWFADWLDWTVVSPALIILVFPLSFRMTCYYCRKAYYRAFFLDPPACAVAEPLDRSKYSGESKFPFILQNLHRFAMYAALFLVVMHWIHLVEACMPIVDGKHRFGMGLGTLVLAFDTVFLTLYVGSCHSVRHLIGGVLNVFSGTPLGRLRYKLWKGVTVINEQHAVYFWISLVSVGLADFYVRMVSSGMITDLRFF